MNLQRVGTLLVKELVQGPKSFIFILVLVAPALLTLMISLVFGTYFTNDARLALVDEGNSDLTPLLQQKAGMNTRLYASPAELMDAVQRGAADLGVILPARFDDQLRGESAPQIRVYVWGESQMQHRIIASTALISSMRDVMGQEAPVEVIQTVLGEGADIPWEQRLMPLVVLMSVMFGGLLIPSTSLVNEKERRTLSALAVTPATMLEIFAAKWGLGVILSMASALVTLFLNRSLGGQPLLLLSALVLGAGFCSTLGVLMGVLVKDIPSLFAAIKGLGIFLYGPGLVQMFPEVPQWIGRLFPTYYVIEPILQITQKGAGLAEIAGELAVLVGLIALAFAALARLSVRQQEAAAAA
jgi:ABC-2 type transport system permease protein